MKYTILALTIIIISFIFSISNAQDVLLPHELEWFDLLKTWSEEVQENTKSDHWDHKTKINNNKNRVQSTNFKTPKKLPKTGSF